jgi:tetratricopeptide (TPR) repeat protein
VLDQPNCWDEAKEYFQRSQAIFETLENKQGLAIALNSLGRVLVKQKKFNEAEKILRRCYDLAVKLEDLRGQAMILNNLGQVLQKQGGEEKFKLALMNFRASIKLGEQLEDQKHLAKVHTAMGRALLINEDIEQAFIELCKGFEIDESLKNSRGLEIVTPPLTRALIKLGRGEEAVAYCQRAIDIAPNKQNLLRLLDNFTLPPKQTFITVVKQGAVKFIKYHERGYRWGYVLPDDGSADIYFREEFIDADCISQLAQYTRVEVEVQQTPKGSRAKSMRII